jgi:hypothetical protein
MGKASSAKKVARAARAGGGKRTGQRRNLGFPLIIGAVIVIGVALIAYAATERRAVAEPLTTDHWHAAYNVDICGTVQPADNDLNGQDLLGIHTHGDNVIHIHPFLDSAAGTNATLGKFFETIGMQVTDDKIVLPDGTSFEEGTDTCDDEPGQIVVARWDSADKAAQGEKPSQIYTDDFDNIRFRNDREAYTIAFLPEGADIPAPNSIATLDQLTDVVGAPTASTTTLPGAETTVPGATTTAPTDTTVPGVPTTTATG